jgi:AcrR family transcriptional regulator
MSLLQNHEMNDLDDSDKPDGRRLRSARTRAAIVASTRKVMAEGNLRPTAREIARVASVSTRTVFAHFSTLNELMRLAVQPGLKTEALAY